ncbi:uncharacterized protein LOC143490818 isoform X2 [Brachyhypopomus gauderio]
MQNDQFSEKSESGVNALVTEQYTEKKKGSITLTQSSSQSCLSLVPHNIQYEGHKEAARVSSVESKHQKRAKDPEEEDKIENENVNLQKSEDNENVNRWLSQLPADAKYFSSDESNERPVNSSSRRKKTIQKIPRSIKSDNSTKFNKKFRRVHSDGDRSSLKKHIGTQTTEETKQQSHSESLKENNLEFKTTFLGVAILTLACFGLYIYFKGPEENHHELRLMLIGKIRAGKSASGNTILGEQLFRLDASPASVTPHCEKRNKVVNGRNVTVFDTPGVMDTWLTSDQTAHNAPECIFRFARGPHVFLLLIRLGRFTEEEKNAVKWIQENFGEEAMRFTLILFTGGDLLGEKPVDKFISNNYELQNLVDIFEGRYHVFNNKKDNPSQVTELFRKIDLILYESMGYNHTRDVYQNAKMITRKEVEMKQMELEKEIRMEEEKKRAEMEILIRQEEEIKRIQISRKMKEDEMRNINNKEEEVRQEEEEKRTEMERLIRREEEVRRKRIEKNMKEEEMRNIKKKEEEVRQEEEVKRRQQEEEMKAEERRKVNELAAKLRDEQYEKTELKAELEKIQFRFFCFLVLTVTLSLGLVYVVYRKRP